MRIPSPAETRLPWLLLATAAGISMASARDQARDWFEHGVAEAWLHNYDPTLASRRIHAELSYEDDDGGESVTEFSWSARGALPVADDLALAYQLGWPVKWKDTGTERISGQGDLETRVGLIGRISPTLRYGSGLVSKFNTAAEDGLGDGVFQLRPVLALRWDAARRINLGINVEYTFTPRDEGSDDLSYLELKIPVALKLTEHWSAEATYKPRWNFLGDGDRHRLVLTATRNWGERKQFAWSISSELPLSDQSLDWKLGSGFTWYFR